MTALKKKLPVGISDFKKIIQNNYYFLDKSLFIKEIIDEDAHVLLIQRPRCFGKSLNLSQLYYFFNIKEKEKLFKGLKIDSEAEKYQKEKNKYPVIKIDFRGVSSVNWEEALAGIKRIIAAEYQKHYYLLESDALLEHEKREFNKIINLSADLTAYKFSLENLSDYLNRYYKERVIILVDEYDEAIQSGYLNNYYQEVIAFMRTFLIKALKDNNSLKKGILTGVLRIARESIFSGLNNLVVFSFLDEKYNQHFGLLEEEVEKIFKDYNLEYQLEEIKDWYNGYNFGGETIYNPWSIINCIYQKAELSPYWVNTADNQIIRELIFKSESEFKKDLELLLQGKNIKTKIEENLVFSDIKSTASSVWSFLLFSGYLRVDDFERDRGKLEAKLSIPNQELLYIYEEIISDWFEEHLSSDKIKLMLNALTKAEFNTFEALLAEFVKNTFSYFDTGGEQPEKVYHAFVLGLLLNLNSEYRLKSNRESGYGRYDIMLISETKAKNSIIIEFKKAASYKNESLEEAAISALKQIEEKNYRSELLNSGRNKIIELGIAFLGKKTLVKGRKV